MAQESEVKGGFYSVLRKSIHEGITSVVGQKTTVSVEFYLDSSIATKNIEAYTASLERMFAAGAKIIEQRCAQALYSNLNLDFHKIDSYKLNDYVVDARKKWLSGEISKQK